jgi:hypothetical protein
MQERLQGRFGKGVHIGLSNADPTEIVRPVDPDAAFDVTTDKYIHNDLKMSVGMFYRGQMLCHLNIQVHFLTNFSQTGRFRRFTFQNFSAGKLPQPPKEPLWLSAGNQKPVLFTHHTGSDMVKWYFCFLNLPGKTVDLLFTVRPAK